MTKLEDLQPNAAICGILPNSLVCVIDEPNLDNSPVGKVLNDEFFSPC